MEQTETAVHERRRMPVGRWTRRALLAVVTVTSMLAAGPAVAAQASIDALAGDAISAAGVCGGWFPATGEHLTSNHLLGVYLQERRCDDGAHFKVAVHNYSINAVGDRAYGLQGCSQLFGNIWGAFIPAHGAWTSPEMLAIDPVFGTPITVQGVIYRPRTSTDDGHVAEVRTGCVD